MTLGGFYKPNQNHVFPKMMVHFQSNINMLSTDFINCEFKMSGTTLKEIRYPLKLYYLVCMFLYLYDKRNNAGSSTNIFNSPSNTYLGTLIGYVLLP